MKANKTTVYTLDKEAIREVCYSLFVQKLKAQGINAYFEVDAVKIEGYGNIEGSMTDVWAQLTIVEDETI